MKGAKIAEMASEQMISRLVAFTVLASIAWAQPAGGVRGRVLDAGTGEPLAWVQVQIAGTTLRTTTEGDGAFQLFRTGCGRLRAERFHRGILPSAAKFHCHGRRGSRIRSGPDALHTAPNR